MSSEAPSSPLRIGILGAARIAGMALVQPARTVEDACAFGIAARQPARAGGFQVRHGLVRAYPDYESMLADPEIDAVYNPLPNSLHARWTLRALELGKHVLCEKPFTANAAEAHTVATAAAASDRVVMEAFHWRYHPLAARMLEVLRSGEIGEVRQIEARFCVPMLLRNDIRWRWDLAGGALMDTGCYAVHIVRTLAQAEPVEVLWARAHTTADPRVDRSMEAELRFADGRTGRVVCSLLSRRLLAAAVKVEATLGELRVFNPVAPHLYHRLTVRTARGTRHERIDGEATYVHQLRAFVAAVRQGTPVLTGPADASANMQVIDAIYERAGLPLRGT